MLFGAFISRTVGAEGTGLYTLVMTVYSLALTLATSGISLTVTRLVASAIGEGRAERVGQIMRSALIYSILFGALSGGGLFLGADIIGRYILDDLRAVGAMRVLALSLIPSAMTAAFTGYFIGVKRVFFNASASVFCQVVKIPLTVALVVYFLPRGTVAAVEGMCIGMTLTEICGFILILLEYISDRKKTATKKTQSSCEMRPVISMALPFAVSAYVRSLLLNIEHILIPKKLCEGGETSSEAYAHYGTLHGMALPAVMYPMSPLSSFAGLLVPEFSEDMAAGRRERMNAICSRALNATISYAIICSVTLFSFAEELGYIIYDSYDAGHYISVLALVIPIMYLDHVTDAILKGIGEHIFSMWVNITDSLISVGLVWILIPRMGIMGYALVILIMEGYNFILSFMRLGRKIKFRLLPICVIAPLVSSSVSCHIASELFGFGGSTSSLLWLVLKMIFALSVNIIIITIFKLKSTKITTKNNTVENKKRRLN